MQNNAGENSKSTELDSTEKDTELSNIGFELRFCDGDGILRLKDEQLSDFAVVDVLELAIPQIAFPLDVSDGIIGFQNKRLQLSTLKLRINTNALLDKLASQLHTKSLIHNVQTRAQKDRLIVLLDFGPARDAIAFSFQLLPVISDSTLSLQIDKPFAYGPLPTNLYWAALAIVTELSGLKTAGLNIELPNILKNTLLELLPLKGWRMPDFSDAKISEILFNDNQITIEFKSTSFFKTKDFVGQVSVYKNHIKRMEELRTTAEADNLAAINKISAARKNYISKLAKSPKSPVVASHLGMIDILDKGLRDTSFELINNMSLDSRDNFDLLSTKAQGASLLEKTQDELEALEDFYTIALPLEQLATGMKIGQICQDSLPKNAIRYLEEVLANHTDNSKVILMLSKIYAHQNNTQRVFKLLSRLVALSNEPSKRTQAHIDAGNILLHLCEDPGSAKKHFERSLTLSPNNQDAKWGLAKSLSKSEDPLTAIALFESIKNQCSKQNDFVAVSEANMFIGDIWLSQNEPQMAQMRFEEALELNNTQTLKIKLANSLKAQQRYEDCARTMEDALKYPGENLGFSKGKAALELASIYLEELNSPKSANTWIEFAIELDSCKTEAIEKKFLVLTKLKENFSAEKDIISKETNRLIELLKTQLTKNLEKHTYVTLAFMLGSLFEQKRSHQNL